MKNEVLSKNGKLTAYGFNCGYVEKKRTKNNETEIQMYKEHSVYHVKIFDVWNTPGRVGCLGIIDNEMLNRVEWRSFYTLRDAKKFFNSFR